MDRSITTDELLREIGLVSSDARALLGRASRVAGVKRGQALEVSELLLLLEALASEGGPVQEIAETLARRALYT